MYGFAFRSDFVSPPLKRLALRRPGAKGSGKPGAWRQSARPCRRVRLPCPPARVEKQKEEH